MPKTSSMPPKPAGYVPGTLTSDRYGNVVGKTKPVAKPVETKSTAPTSDRWGNVISPAPGAVKESTVLPPGAVGKSASDGKVDWE